MRIFPALVVEVSLFAIILGPILTESSLAQYFSDWQFRSYFKNMFGDMHYTLPSVYLHNPLPVLVNAQLWTVPYELRCYEALTLLAVLGLYKRRAALVGAVCLAFLYLFSGDVMSPGQRPDHLLGNQLVFCFLVGLLLFRFRSLVPWSRPFAIVCAVAAFALLDLPRCDTLACIPLSYLTVYLGLTNPRRAPLIFSGDYSYGLFLYGFPIQQAVAWLGPWTHHWYVNLALALPLTGFVAVCSWWFVEKPVLARRKVLIRLEDRIVSGVQELGERLRIRAPLGRPSPE